MKDKPKTVAKTIDEYLAGVSDDKRAALVVASRAAREGER